MGTLVYEAQSAYPYFMSGKLWDERKARDFLADKNHIEERLKIIEFVYQITLMNEVPAVNEAVQAYIMFDMSIKEAARFKEVNENTLKSNIHYFEMTFGKSLKYADKSIFVDCVWQKAIPDLIMKRFMEIFEKAKEKFNSSKYNTGRLVTNRNLLINIPKAYYCDEPTKEQMVEFQKFLNAIKPYFVVQRKMIQDKINASPKLVGYFNYLIATDGGTEIDISYREAIKAIINETDIEAFRKERAKRENEQEKQEDEIIDFGEKTPEQQEAWLNPKSTRVQYDF